MITSIKRRNLSIYILLILLPQSAWSNSGEIIIREVAQCAVSSGIEIDSNMKGSLEDIFSGDGAVGNAKISMESFLDKFDSDELKITAYKLYVECVMEKYKNEH